MILFRADGNPKIGSGHIMRCLSLADAFQEAGHDSLFVTASGHLQSLIEGRSYGCHVLHTEYDHMERELDVFLPLLQEKQPAFLILDSYFVTPAYMRALTQEAPLVYIDDMNAFDYPADVVANYNIYAEDMAYPPGKKYLRGPKYTPLRREFQNVPQKEKRQDVKDILLLTGGTDLEHVVLTLLRHLREHPLSEGITLHIVLGALNQDAAEIEQEAEHFPNVRLYRNITNISELMQACDVAISAAGTTLYELCACGLPTVTYILADNQIFPAEAFERAGLMLCAGDVRGNVDFAEELFLQVKRLIDDASLRRGMAEEMQNVVDGAGAKWLVKELKRLFSKNF